MSKPKRDQNIQIPTDVLKQLLTPSEIRMLKNRWQIINLLENGLSIRKIAAQVKVGTDTVVRTIRMVEKNNILSKSTKHRKRGFPSGIKSQTPWIFGKSSLTSS